MERDAVASCYSLFVNLGWSIGVNQLMGQLVVCSRAANERGPDPAYSVNVGRPSYVPLRYSSRLQCGELQVPQVLAVSIVRYSTFSRIAFNILKDTWGMRHCSCSLKNHEG